MCVVVVYGNGGDFCRQLILVQRWQPHLYTEVVFVTFVNGDSVVVKRALREKICGVCLVLR